jgi:ABC-type lipoprotein export system ATPase subunit
MWFEIENLHKSYGIPGGPAGRTVLDGLSLSMNPGETIAVIGPSGSGKTTLLNLIAGLDRPDSGRILFDGKDIFGMNEAGIYQYRSTRIGMVFQLHLLLPQCTLQENVLIPALALYRKIPAEVMKRAEMLIKRSGLWEVRNQKPGELSGGECQRAAVARALINNPDLLLADEPTGSLDHANAVNLMEIFLEISKEQGKSLILVTHSLEMASKTSRTLTLLNGNLS